MAKDQGGVQNPLGSKIPWKTNISTKEHTLHNATRQHTKTYTMSTQNGKERYEYHGIESCVMIGSTPKGVYESWTNKVWYFLGESPIEGTMG